MHAIYEEVRVALHNIWRRRWLALAIAWVVSLLGWLYISTIPNTYESKASVYVDTQTSLPGQMAGGPDERRKYMDKAIRTLLANDNLKEVVRSTDLARNVSTEQELALAAEGLRGKVEVEASEDNTLKIAAESGSGGLSNKQNAELAKAIVQKLLDIFIENNRGGIRGDATTAARLMQQQIAQQAVEMSKAAAALEQFESNNLIGLPGTGSVDQRVATLRMTASQLDSQLITAQGALAAANSALAATPPTISTPGQMIPGQSGVSAAASEVSALQGQLSSYESMGYTESHPDMISTRARLRQARARLAAEGPQAGPRMSGGSTMQNPSYMSAQMMQAERQASVSSLTAQRNQVQAALQQFGRVQAENPGVQAEQAKLQNAYDAVKAKYDQLLGKQQDLLTVGPGIETARVRVIKPPQVENAPSKPNRPMLLTIMLILGLGAGGGVAFALSQINPTYANSNRLEKATGLPVIGSVSSVVGQTERDNSRLKLKYFAGGTAALAGAWMILIALEMYQRGSGA